jgi:hypothetical protein
MNSVALRTHRSSDSGCGGLMARVCVADEGRGEMGHGDLMT